MSTIGTAYLTRQLIDRAIEIGFDMIGITAARDADTYEHFERWLDFGYAGEMAYMERTRQLRKNPRKLMQDCKSVVVVGVCYANTSNMENLDRDSGTRELRGCVSIYACRRDYHNVIQAKLVELREWLKEKLPWAKGKACVDSSPILERELAVRVGFGWYGKSTNVISRLHGSYFFIGELLTNVELEPTESFERDRCGTCNRCIDACPTGAIVSPRMLDARRCISYLTVEHRSAIQFELRHLIGRWIFGCDVCQQVCPWNRMAGAGRMMGEFKPDGEMMRPKLLELLSMSEEEFNSRFAGTPIIRIGRERFLRNVAVALGNMADERAVEPLAMLLLSDDDKLVRSHVAWALGRIGGRAAKMALERSWKWEQSGAVKGEIERALEMLR